MTRKLLSLALIGCLFLLLVGCGAAEDAAMKTADEQPSVTKAEETAAGDMEESGARSQLDAAGVEERSDSHLGMIAADNAAGGEMTTERAPAAPSMLAEDADGPASRGRNMKFGGGDDKAEGLAGGGRAPQLSQARNEVPPLPIPELQPGEELWVIEAQPKNARNAGILQPESSGAGCLMAVSDAHQTPQPVPLKHTEVSGQIDGYIASVDVTQQFHNPFDEVIEASYVFPLPHSAAINEFVMKVGDRRIRGIIREKAEAERIYRVASSQKYAVSMMTQQRANIFTQKVANIQPGRQIDISIRYFNTLRYENGAYEFVFPMVVSPRFNPSGTEGVGAVGPGQIGASGQTTEVQYVPAERSGRDIALFLNINAGVEVGTVRSVNHEVGVTENGATGRTVTLSPLDSIPNRDFVLRYQVAGDTVRSGLLTHTDRHGSYFTLMLYPPAELSQVNRAPMEMVFVMDCSGSMNGPAKNGKPLRQAKDAVRFALNSLTERDTFQIIRFSSNSSKLGAEPIPATAENINLGLEYLESLKSDGGTQMIEGLSAALDFPHDEGRFRVVTFLTDGQIGNEQQVLGIVGRKLGASRIFSFGVGESPNRFLMDRLAILGRGAVSYLSLNDDPIEVMERFNRQISHPVLTDLHIDWGEMRVGDVYPGRLPDLIVGRPVIITGRYRGQPGDIKISGRVDFETAEFTVNSESGANKHRGIASVWARLKIKDLMNTLRGNPQAKEEIQNEVLEIALDHNLMSSVTSFVAVDTMTRAENQSGRTVEVPSPLPNGGEPSGD